MSHIISVSDVHIKSPEGDLYNRFLEFLYSSDVKEAESERQVVEHEHEMTLVCR